MKDKSTFSFWVVFVIVVLLFVGAVLLVYRDAYVQADYGAEYLGYDGGGSWFSDVVSPPEASAPEWITVTTPDGSQSETYYNKEY